MTVPMTKPFFEDYEISMPLPSVELGPMERYDYIPIALILRDTNPLHLDRVYAQERGLPDVVQLLPVGDPASPQGSRQSGIPGRRAVGAQGDGGQRGLHGRRRAESPQQRVHSAV